MRVSNFGKRRFEEVTGSHLTPQIMKENTHAEKEGATAFPGGIACRRNCPSRRNAFNPYARQSADGGSRRNTNRDMGRQSWTRFHNDLPLRTRLVSSLGLDPERPTGGRYNRRTLHRRTRYRPDGAERTPRCPSDNREEGRQSDVGLGRDSDWVSR